MEALLSYYQILTITLAVVWLALFCGWRDLRREMLTLGAFAIFLLPLALAFSTSDVEVIQDQFAKIGVVDVIFSFLIAGIAGVSFHALLGKHYHHLPKRRSRRQAADAQLWLMRLFLIILSFTWAVILLVVFFELSLPRAVLLAAAMLAIYITSHRRDLLADALWSAALTGLIVFLCALVSGFFSGAEFALTPVYSSATIGTVPVDLIIWSIALGLALGPLYEFVRRLEVR